MQTIRLPLLILLFSACTMHKNHSSDTFQKQALDLLKTTPIVDTHIDFPYNLVERNLWYTADYTRYALRNEAGEFDYERAKKGGLYGAFMSIYIPSHFQEQPGRPREVADSLINVVHAIASTYPGKFAIPKRAADVTENFKKGIVSLPMGMENGAPMVKIEDVKYFHERGIRYVTLTHGKDNHICDSSYDTRRTNKGLSEFGKKLVAEMNRVGIMVDVSHLDDQSIADVLAIATRPVVATHSACRHFTPDFERNLNDEQIRQIAAKGGVVQVPFAAQFLNNEARKIWNEQVAPELKKRDLKVRSAEGTALVREFEQKTGVRLFLSVRDVADQIDHIVKIAGAQAAGFGSDYDGVGPTMPPDLADVSMFPNLVAELLRRGYKPDEVRGFCGGNLLRVWKACE